MSTTEVKGIQRDDTVHDETYFTAADMATAAAQGFREGQAAELAAMRAGGEPVAEMVPCYTPSGKRVAVISRFQHLPIGTKLYATPQPTQAQAGAVPLTDERLDAAVEAWFGSDNNYDFRERMRAAIDSSHGIKGGQHGDSTA